MTAIEAINYIESCTWSETRLGLDRTRQLLEAVGSPQKDLKFIHVAGTNGKGSVCAMLDSIMRQAGYTTGLYTSPYICRFNERMQVNGESISDEMLAELTEHVKPAADAMDDHPSQFELVTAISMLYFKRMGCDIVVLEVGLGGELDSTNVIDCPEVAVLMNIGLEHTEYLGDTLAKIASAKAGIIKPGCKAVCYRNEAEVENVFEARCAALGAELHKADFDSIRLHSVSLDGQEFSHGALNGLKLPLLGEHQLKNAAVVLKTIEILNANGWTVSEDAIRTGLAQTVWPARFEILSRDPLFIVDGAHNPQCAEALADNLKLLFKEQKLVIIIGVLADKDYDSMLNMLTPFASRFVCITPDSPRALSAEDLAAHLREKGFEADSCGSIPEAIRLALKVCGGAPVLACGSLYMAGDVKNHFPKAERAYLRRRCLNARRALTVEERRSFSERICTRIAESEAFKKAETVMIYKAMPDEVDLSFLEGLDKTFVFPYCTDDCHMFALKPQGEGAWASGSYGILEPVVEKSVEVSPEGIDLVICPCSGFDEALNRMGMGKGYYDRYLPKCVNADIIAAAFEVQKLNCVKASEWDIPMQAVFTEEKQYTAKNA